MKNSLLYNFGFIPIGKLILKLLTYFIPKIKDRESNLENSLLSLKKLSKSSKRIWFHSASMGEFEQAKPIIELIKARNPELEIVVSFFSPSGYNNQINYKYADSIIYLPFDDKKIINTLYETIQPSVVIIIRYEIWRNLLEIGKLRNIPIYLVAATFPRSALLNKFLKIFTKNNYLFFTKIFCVNQENYNLFLDFGLKQNIQLSADTRFDRIIQNIDKLKVDGFVLKREFWKSTDKVIVAGSTWEKDENFLLQAINNIDLKNIRLIIIPHEPTEKHITELTNKIKNHILFTEIENKNQDEIQAFLEGNILIINKIGVLLKLYSVADIAYVGGAFGVGVHSVTEPAGYGIPVICGEDMTNSPDAIIMKKSGGLLTFSDSDQLISILKVLQSDNSKYNEIANLNKDYVYQNKGESEKIYQDIISNI